MIDNRFRAGLEAKYLGDHVTVEQCNIIWSYAESIASHTCSSKEYTEALKSTFIELAKLTDR